MHASEKSMGKTSTWAAGKGVSLGEESPLCYLSSIVLGGVSPNKISLGNSLPKVLMKSNEESSISTAIPEIQGP